ncbi:MAG: alpha/beta hydrolase [Anaerolineae bacterium]|nr:alpha/beta hydrolase [Anaerolineae bacterium]
MENKLTPQQRWQTYRTKLPQFTRWQKIGFGLAVIMVFLIFVLFLLPFLLGLGGPRTIDAADLADPNGAFADLHGESLYYIHQPGKGDPVILIHGFGESTVTWQDTVPALADAGFDVYGLDLIGFGLSEKGLTADMSHPAQAERIALFMEQQGIDKADFVAHAMGANVVMHFAFLYPDRVGSLVLADATLQTESTAALPSLVLEVPSFQRWARVLIRWIVPATTETQLLSAAEKDEVISEDLVNAYDRTLYTADWDLSLLAMLRDSSQNTLWWDLSTLDIPVLVLWGAEDGWISPETGKSLAAEIPGASYREFEGVGHLPMHEAPDEFNNMVIQFLG